MRRAFLLVELSLTAISLWDFVTRIETFVECPPIIEFLQVLVASSATAVMVASLVFFMGWSYWIVSMPLIVWGIVCVGMEGFARAYFHDTGRFGDAFMVKLVTMDLEKICDFLLPDYILAVVLVPTLLLLAVVTLVSYDIRRRPSVSTIAIGAVLFAVSSCMMRPCIKYDHLVKALTDHDFLKGYSNAVLFSQLKEGGQAIDVGEYGTEESDLLSVFVIGESSTRTHWSLYGYGRSTTPNLCAITADLVAFSNVSAVSGLTPYALRDLFVSKTVNRYVALPSAAANAGFSSVFFSAQEKFDEYNGADELLFNTCAERTYLRDSLKWGSFTDEALIPLACTAIDKGKGNRIIFIHTYGSHCVFKDRYPPSFSKFKGELPESLAVGVASGRRQAVNEYDNSILFTDHFLMNLIEHLRKKGGNAILVYVSDHGESPESYARNQRSTNTYKIPFFIWTSAEYQSRHQKSIARLREMTARKMETPELFPIFQEVLGIKSRKKDSH